MSQLPCLDSGRNFGIGVSRDEPSISLPLFPPPLNAFQAAVILEQNVILSIPDCVPSFDVVHPFLLRGNSALAMRRMASVTTTVLFVFRTSANCASSLTVSAESRNVDSGVVPVVRGRPTGRLVIV